MTAFNSWPQSYTSLNNIMTPNKVRLQIASSCDEAYLTKICSSYLIPSHPAVLFPEQKKMHSVVMVFKVLKDLSSNM